MSVDVDLYKYDYTELFNALKGLGITDEAKLEEMLLAFGFRFGDVYIILNDEHVDEAYNSYYNLAAAINTVFGLNDDSFDILLNMGELLDAHKSVEDVLGEDFA